MAAAAPTKHFDLVVVGGGSGGLAAAKEAAKQNPGKSVLCLDHVAPSGRGTKWGLGGTCVNVGCIPKKLMHHAGTIGASLHGEAGQYGWEGIEGAKHSWPRMRELVGDYIHSLNFAYGVGLRGAGVTYAEARATFDSPSSLVHTTNAGKATRVTFDRAIISTGGRPTVPTIPGAELGVTSDDLFWLPKSPGKTLVVGAGYIALEVASFLQHIGTDVSVMVRGKVLRKMDQQSAEMLAELMERDGVRFLSGANPLALRSLGEAAVPANSVAHPTQAGYVSFAPDAKGNERWIQPSTGVVQTVHKKPAGLVTYGPAVAGSPIEVTYRSATGESVIEQFDTVVFAIGRTAAIGSLALDTANVRVVNGKVLVDDADATTNPRIFAIGDVAAGVPAHQEMLTIEPADRPELTPVAIQCGQMLARRLWTAQEQLNGGSKAALMNYDHIASTVFASPSEYAFVGMSEEQARLPVAQGGIGAENVEVYWSRFGALETSPLHPTMPELRSTAYTGSNMWASRYIAERKLDWPELMFDPTGMTANVLYQPTPADAPIEATVTEKLRAADGSVVYNVRIEADGGVDLTNVPQAALRLQPAVSVENAELFFKANCLAKLVVDKTRNELVVGLHFVGANAGEVVQGFALGMSLGATKPAFDRLVGIHPTAAEEFTVLTVKQSEGNTPLKQAGCGGGSCG